MARCAAEIERSLIVADPWYRTGANQDTHGGNKEDKKDRFRGLLPFSPLPLGDGQNEALPGR
ncbi:MAG: hypothetical protein O7I42_26405 [Alphaproteobacteria bacterium]|nr:hypothetical protein [Alphaproteobacteria bacterium]